jgi:Asp-tRNA(Asn)/Glu-tRNA(Gln) amidotransferase A subunit family amidase
MLSALALAKRIEAGELTPASVINLCEQAIAQQEKDVGAFVALDIPRAKAMARERAKELAGSPLRGLPVGFKDIFDTADFPTSYGSAIYAGNRPRTDAALVAMTRRAGGIILGKTVSTEMAFLDPAGTRNPRNLAHTPGGSSSGSAAAVAAGMLPIAVGTQTGGSVIRPAAFCGVAGFKPSFRLLPMVGVKCFSWSLDTAGLFGASVPDVAFAAAAITGRDLRIDQRAPSSPTIGLMRTHIWSQASAAMQRAVESAARVAEKAGAKVRDVALPPLLEEAHRAHGPLQNYEAARALAFEYDQHYAQLPKLLRELLDKAAGITAETYDDARRTTKRARYAFTELMAGVDVLITPSALGAAPHGLGSTGDATFNRLWTLMGSPCVNVAGLEDESGLPLGIQVVGRFARDQATLEAASFLERALAADLGPPAAGSADG